MLFRSKPLPNVSPGEMVRMRLPGQKVWTPATCLDSAGQVTSPQLVRFPQHFAGTHLCTRVEGGTVRVKCLAPEHNTMSLARARTRTARSRVERTNHQATAPSVDLVGSMRNSIHQHLNLFDFSNRQKKHKILLKPSALSLLVIG